MGLFGLFKSRPQEDAPAAHPLALRSLEDKIDRLLQELQIPPPEVADGMPPVVRQHLERGDKLNAIKAYRDLTNVGLAEAKEAVERGAADPIRRMEQKMDRILEGLGCAPRPAPPRPARSEVERQVENLLRQGNKIEAIRIYRNHLKSSLSEAKDAVERMERGLR